MSWGKYRKVTKVDKEGNENIIKNSYKINFIDSARFMTNSLSNLGNNLAGEIHETKCKAFNCFPEYENVKDNLIKYKWPSYNKNYSNKIDEELKKWFKS